MDKLTVTKASMPSFEEYTEMLRPLWDSKYITNMGELHNKLQDKLKNYLEVPNISLMVNGHMSLELAITSMNFPKGSEVITTPFTFISTTHAIIRNGLVPVFCDIKLSDYTIDENKIEELITDKTVAILPVHVYGNVCKVEKIQEIANAYNLKVIYDAAHAFGVKYNGMGIGQFGDMSVFSFHATKVFHTIEGGAVAFHDSSLENSLYNLKNFGIRSEEIVDEVGTNAKLNEFCAAMGLCNLRHIDENISKRKIAVNYYREQLKNIEGIRFAEDKDDNSQPNYSYFPILIDENKYNKTRDELYNTLKAQEIYSRKYFYPLTCDQKCFGTMYKTANVDIARYVASRILTLPLFDDITHEDISRICNTIRQ